VVVGFSGTLRFVLIVRLMWHDETSFNNSHTN
jgi:hypothetical protein